VLVSGLVAFPFVGADLGGFGEMMPTDEMMVRWVQAGAWTYPFFRSHASRRSTQREPWFWPNATYTRFVKSINDRYVMIGVWYTHGVYSMRNGRSPVVPLWFEFPEVDRFHDIDRAVLLADSLAVFPVLDEGAKQITILKAPGVWYDFYDGKLFEKDETRDVTMDDVPILIRGGRIVPLYKSHGETALATIVTPMTLLIATDEQNHGEGSIYLDDGVTFDFESGVFLERNFTWDKGTLRCSKRNVNEKTIPEFLQSSIISEIYIYSSSGVLSYKDLNLKVSGEWTWSPSGVLKGISNDEKGLKGKVVAGINGGFVGMLVMGVVAGLVLVMRSRKQKRLVSDTALNGYT
jgi:alpha-glucosidase (family GH31 glycosyl hydrolase)